jgi:hypothetical protein
MLKNGVILSIKNSSVQGEIATRGDAGWRFCAAQILMVRRSSILSTRNQHRQVMRYVWSNI